MKDKQNNTVLHLAISVDKTETAETMLDQLNTKRGEEWKHTDRSNFIRLKDFNGETALHIAAERGNTT